MGIVLLTIGFFLLLGCILALSYITLKMYTHYNSLIQNADGKSLIATLDTLSQELALSKKDIATLRKQYDTMERENKSHIQNIGLLRFNPFKDTGGDQSFIISLVDAEGTGILLSGLYSRSGTRWYAKKIQSGKGVDHELSDEEKKAIKLAQSHT